MKRALLWLGPLACLALAGIYAYAWYDRNPLVLASESVNEGMTYDEVAAVFCRRHDDERAGCINITGVTPKMEEYIWSDGPHYCSVVFLDGRVSVKRNVRTDLTMYNKVRNWISDPTSLWH